jgi:hypothetical protein
MTAPLHCAGCGCEGRMPIINWRRDEPDAPPPLHTHFGWHADPGKPAMRCPRCEKALNQRKARRARRAGR